MMSRRYTDKIEGLKARKESIRQSIEELEEKRSATEKRDMIIALKRRGFDFLVIADSCLRHLKTSYNNQRCE